MRIIKKKELNAEESTSKKFSLHAFTLLFCRFLSTTPSLLSSPFLRRKKIATKNCGMADAPLATFQTPHPLRTFDTFFFTYVFLVISAMQSLLTHYVRIIFCMMTRFSDILKFTVNFVASRIHLWAIGFVMVFDLFL